HLGGEAGADAPDVYQLAVLIKPEHERADRIRPRRRGDIPDDHELLPVRALRLDPIAVAAGTIRRVAALRHDAFEAQAARVLEHDLTFGVEVLAQAQRRLAAREQRAQRTLSLGE